MRIILSILCMILTIAPITARSFEAQGVGSNPNEARTAAKVELNRYINGESVYVSSEIHTYDAGKGVNEFFTQNASSVSYGSLLGVKYSEPVLVGDNYECTASIGDDSIILYLTKMRTLASDIVELHGAEVASVEENILRYQSLLEALREFEACRHIAFILGADDADVPTLGLNLTFNSVCIEYEGYLAEREEISSYQKYTDTAYYDSIMKELALIHEEQLRIRSNESAVKKAERDRQNKRINSMLDAMTEMRLTVNETFNDAENAINEYKRMRKAIDDIRLLAFQMQEKERTRIITIIEAEVDTLRNAPYRISEKSKGQPTKEAVVNRNRKIDKIITDYWNQYAEIERKINNAADLEISRQSDELSALQESLRRQTYTISSNDSAWLLVDDVSIVEQRRMGIAFDYDANGKCWNVGYQVVLDEKEFMITTDLPITAFEDTSRLDKEERMDFIDRLSALMQDGSFDASLEFRLDFDDYGNVTVYVNSISLYGPGLVWKDLYPQVRVISSGNSAIKYIVCATKTDDAVIPVVSSNNKVFGFGYRVYGSGFYDFSLKDRTSGAFGARLGGTVSLVLYEDYVLGASCDLNWYPSYAYWKINLNGELGWKPIDEVYLFAQGSFNASNSKFSASIGVSYQFMPLLSVGTSVDILNNADSIAVSVLFGVGNL